ncbi:hypothetical protein E2562_006637 [Oryza meyeriana var. granulata]|uniref:Uncharacterized protein n=1 Tax=Oryza meyeriana var. granulata TaxID=110450 RepID=A0A6G1EFY1_9ORYZ|nr:hypothetical protein E2562_006637 [Oryza meyeriana var. granulata]
MAALRQALAYSGGGIDWISVATEELAARPQGRKTTLLRACMETAEGHLSVEAVSTVVSSQGSPAKAVASS